MAIFSVNNSNDRFTLTLTVTETSYSVTDNTSTLSWSLDLKANTSYNFSLYSIGLSVVLNGTTVKSQTRAQRIQYSVDKYGTVNLASGSGFVVKHNDDGSKTIPVVYSIDMESVSYTPGSLSGSGTMPLTTIARYSTLTIPAGGTLGVKQSITVNRPSNLTHTVTWVCGTQKGTLCTNSTATTLDFTPDIGLASQNTTGSTVSITFTITTTGVGDKTHTATYAIPASVKPQLSIAVDDATDYKNTYGGYVQGWSKLKITATPTLAYGSPIDSYSITAEGKPYTTNPATTDVISSGNDVPIATTVSPMILSGIFNSLPIIFAPSTAIIEPPTTTPSPTTVTTSKNQNFSFIASYQTANFDCLPSSASESISWSFNADMVPSFLR